MIKIFLLLVLGCSSFKSNQNDIEAMSFEQLQEKIIAIKKIVPDGDEKEFVDQEIDNFLKTATNRFQLLSFYSIIENIRFKETLNFVFVESALKVENLFQARVFRKYRYLFYGERDEAQLTYYLNIFLKMKNQYQMDFFDEVFLRNQLDKNFFVYGMPQIDSDTKLKFMMWVVEGNYFFPPKFSIVGLFREDYAFDLKHKILLANKNPLGISNEFFRRRLK